MKTLESIGTALTTIGLLGTLALPANAGMALTPAGAGFGLSTFASNFPSTNDVGPLGIAFLPGGQVMVADAPGNVRIFPTDTDGQNAGAVPVAQNYGFGNAIGLSQSAGIIYMTRQTIGDLIQVNNSGTFNQVIATGLRQATGTATNPLNGHIFVSTLGNIGSWDVDPIAKTKALFVNASADGLTLSADGKTLYAAVNDADIAGFDIATKTQVFDSGFIPGTPDGTALGTGSLANQIFANTNGGQLYEINLIGTPVPTLIATGGSRGDFVTVDPTNGTLLVTQNDSVLRLTAPAGGGFGSTPVPEPSAILLWGIGACAFFGPARIKRRKLAPPD